MLLCNHQKYCHGSLILCGKPENSIMFLKFYPIIKIREYFPGQRELAVYKIKEEFDMSMVGNTGYAQAAGSKISGQPASTSAVNEAAGKTTAKTVKGVTTYGDAKLSDKAMEYYKSLIAKYGNMNFVLVASDKKAEAEAIKGSFATPGRMTVLIDEEKIERMASDENYRRQIEATIANAASGINQMFSQIASTGVKVKAYGITVDDNGMAGYFAVVDKALEIQREHIEEKKEEKLQQKIEERREAQQELLNGKYFEDEDTVTITAGSIEELIRKLQEYGYSSLADSVLTDEEKLVGQSFDFSV